MTQDKWSTPSAEPLQARADAPSRASGQSPSSQWGGKEYAVHFIFSMLLFGVIGLLFSSWFPVALGVFLFFTSDDFIEWVLQRIGIRLVPNTLGPEFIKAFVFMAGLWILLGYWKDSAPAWVLPPSSPPPVPVWYLIAGVAFLCALLKIISAAAVRRLLPPFGIAITPIRQKGATLGLTVLLGLMVFLIAGLIFSDWLGAH